MTTRMSLQNTSVLKKRNPTKRITAASYHKHMSVIEFTDNDLEVHRSFFNPERYPEFFDFSTMGLDYDDTIIVEVTKVNNAADTSTFTQYYRPGKNKKYSDILRDVKENGVDVRCKMSFGVIDNDGNLLYIFGGNTIHEVISNGTNLQNRIVHTFRMNKNFSITNLIAIGARMNSLEKVFGANDLNTLTHVLNQLRTKGGDDWTLASDASLDTQMKYAERIKTYLAYMMAVDKKDMNKAKTDKLIVAMMDDQLDEKAFLSFGSYKAVLDYMKTEQGYYNTPFSSYGAYGCFGSKIHTHYSIKFNEFSKMLKTDPDYFNVDKGTYNLIIYMGTPDPCNPENDFWKKYAKEFFPEFSQTEKFLLDNYYMENPKGIVKFKIIGALQQVKALEHIWPLGSVVPFDELMEYYHKNISSTLPTVMDFVDEENDDNVA